MTVPVCNRWYQYPESGHRFFIEPRVRDCAPYILAKEGKPLEPRAGYKGRHRKGDTLMNPHVLYTCDGIALTFKPHPNHPTYWLIADGKIGDSFMQIIFGEITLGCAVKNREALQKIIKEDGPSTEPLIFVDYLRSCIAKDGDGAIFINPRTLQGSVAKIYLDLEEVDALLNIFKALITDLNEVQP